MRIAIVGICASGKTTLVRGLREAGYDAYNVAQEHSCVHDFWNKKHPDVLVMIDATLPTVKKRRVVYWGQDRIDTQHKRLADAKAHADLYIQTDDLDAAAVRQKVIDFLETREN
ncbi:AAA family ATPase [uncultured Selenomonas sp.]|uniref:AAA family ATPase n=1 Tax=uncultured Selenomonas sp. TaxID=159275 RepID=UPI0025EE944D|nr:AAA family ATPase [uncultured Selenomonas sp.]